MLTIGLNVGFEQDGKGDDFLRPVLIIKKLNNRFFIGLPLTKSIKKSPHVVAVSDSSFAIFSQIRAFDSKRLLYRMETIPSFRFESIKQKLRDYL